MALTRREVDAWRLSIEAAVEAGGVPLGHFNWPYVLGKALDALEECQGVQEAAASDPSRE